MSDGLASIKNVIAKSFPNAQHQLFVVHIKRTIISVFPRSKRLEIAKELSQIFAIETKKVTPVEAFENLYKFVERHKKSYPSLKSLSSDRNAQIQKLNVVKIDHFN